MVREIKPHIQLENFSHGFFPDERIGSFNDYYGEKQFLELHNQHLELGHQLVSFYDKIKSAQEINRMELSRVYIESQKVSRQRSQAILENVLEISHEDGYINPAIICGRSHIEKGLKPIFDSGVFTFTLESCQDYINLFSYFLLLKWK